MFWFVLGLVIGAFIGWNTAKPVLATKIVEFLREKFNI